MANRDSETLLSARRDRVMARWDLKDEIVLVRSGAVLPMAGSDMEHSFQPHPDFAYLSGRGIPDAVLAFDALQDQWQLFGPRATPDDQVWHLAAYPIGVPLE